MVIKDLVTYAKYWGVTVAVVEDPTVLSTALGGSACGWSTSPGHADTKLHYARRLVLWARENQPSDWPWLLHEISHVAAASEAPRDVDEMQTMLGWELLSVRHLKLDEKHWSKTILSALERKTIQESVRRCRMVGLFNGAKPTFERLPVADDLELEWEECP